MVAIPHTSAIWTFTLSVLALSSRFDGRGDIKACQMTGKPFQYSLCRVVLMVPQPRPPRPAERDFQYSLCRVVLMVRFGSCHQLSIVDFQYSLCRVVLMVGVHTPFILIVGLLSVLALSSRFDGPREKPAARHYHALSVLALSSRFDGPRSGCACL